MKTFQITPQFNQALSKNWGWFLGWGILLTLIGAFAMVTAVFTTILSMVFLGGLLIASGAVIIFDTFHFWWRQWSGFFSHFIVGLLYVCLGLILIFGPLTAAITLTLVLGIFLIALGCLRVYQALSWKLPRWEWAMVSGIITIILGILILAQWPVSGLFVIGLFIGIDIFFTGWVYIMISLFARGNPIKDSTIL